MGKLIRNGIEYGGGNGTDIFELTQSEYDALKQAGTLVHNALYVITDAPNLNYTAEDLSYDGGTQSTKEAIEEINTFSTEEKAIGTWIDGSTIYERFFTGLSLTGNANTWMNTGISQQGYKFSKIIECHGYDNLGQYFAMSAGYQSGEVIVATNMSRSSYPINTLRMRYTKTA